MDSPIDTQALQQQLLAADYVADRPLAATLGLFCQLGRPLLLEGDAGVGKTEVARVLARVRETELIRLQCYEGLDISSAVLGKLEAFASFNGPDFYGLPRNSDTVTLRRDPWQVPGSYPLGDGQVVPLKAGEQINWRVLASP